MSDKWAVKLVALASAVAVASASPAIACHVPTTATFVFAALPEGVPSSATVLDIAFPHAIPTIGVPRPGWPIYATAKIRKVIRGQKPERRTIEVTMPGSVCTELADQPLAGLIAGEFSIAHSGKVSFVPFWLPGNERPGSESGLHAPAPWP
jgi:hypothetical protein